MKKLLVRVANRLRLLEKTRYDRAYRTIREPKADGMPSDGAKTLPTILDALKTNDIPYKDMSVDLDGYRAYFKEAGYATRYPKYYRNHIEEKSLEHYIAARLLRLEPSDVYIDIASEGSPVPEIYGRLYGCRTYRQDLRYRAGLHADRIGGSAAAMPVSDGFATKMGLHCSFEHFEGDADIGFCRELHRVLRPGGRCCIVPLYLNETHAVLTDPLVMGDVRFEPGAVVYASKRWGNRHGRLYDAAHLKSRVIDNLNGFDWTLYRITNVRDVDQKCHARFALLLEKREGA